MEILKEKSYEITELCRFSSSSESPNTARVENNLSINAVKYLPKSAEGDGFITRNEENPFLICDSPYFFDSFSLRLNIGFGSDSENCAETCFIKISTFDGIDWVSIDEVPIDPVNRVFKFESLHASSVKVEVVGTCSLTVTEFSLFSNCLEMNPVADPFIYFSKGSNFGLGGQLAVYASTVARAGLSNVISEVYLDNNASLVLSYPLSVNEISSTRLNNINAYLSSSLKFLVFGDGKYSSDKPRGRYKPNKPYEKFENGRLAYVSRDDNKLFSQEGNEEYKLLSKRNAYRKLVPSSQVYSRLDYLTKKYFSGIDFDTCLGVHFRHGNGERHYSQRRDLWGVKPPSPKTFERSLEYILTNNNEIDTLVLASDCPEIARWLEHHFGSRLRVVFISELIQEAGSGCSHRSKRFDPRSRYRKFEPTDEQIAAFAEVLALAKCGFLLGGDSYMFEAIKSYSDVPLRNLYYLDNSDRYVKLSRSLTPLADCGSALADSVIKTFDQKSVDGIFCEDLGKMIKLYYFNEYLASFSSEEDLTDADVSALYDKIVSLRFY